MGLLVWMILNDVRGVVLTWTKCRIGREQDFLIHLNSVEQKNSTKDFPVFIEKSEIWRIKFHRGSGDRVLPQDFSDTFSITSKTRPLSGIVFFLEVHMHISNEAQRLWTRKSQFLSALTEIFLPVCHRGISLLCNDIHCTWLLSFPLASSSTACYIALSFTGWISCDFPF